MGSHSHGQESGHSHGSGSSQDEHDINIWKGLTAMLGVVFFYFTEKFLTMVVECRKKKQRKTQVSESFISGGSFAINC